MIEDAKIVKTIETKAGGKSGTYWTVTWQDGKKDNIFNAAWLPLLEQSQKENRLLHFTKEKKGNYFNIVSLELATLIEESLAEQSAEQSEEPPAEQSETQQQIKTPVTHAIKDRTKDEQIERAVWIKELGECLRSGEIDKTTLRGKALRRAYYTEMCRVLGINIKSERMPMAEVQPAKSLIEEAKRLGAKEIRKEDN